MCMTQWNPVLDRRLQAAITILRIDDLIKLAPDPEPGQGGT